MIATDATRLEIPTLETERLRLRAPRWSDFEAYAAFCASPRSVGVGGPYSRDSAFGKFCSVTGHWQMRGFGRWLVADRASDEALGIVGPFYPEDWPEPEIAWSVFDAAEGRGIAHEAAYAARQYAYGVLGWTTAVSLTAPDNTRSQALARRLGAIRDGSYQHAEAGELYIWRHPGPGAL